MVSISCRLESLKAKLYGGIGGWMLSSSCQSRHYPLKFYVVYLLKKPEWADFLHVEHGSNNMTWRATTQ